MPHTNPITLTESEAEQLTQAERQIHDILPVLDDLESCGVECDQLRIRLQQDQESLSEIRKRFVPFAG